MRKLIGIAAAVAALVASASAMADTATLTVAASVKATCKLYSGGSMDFGQLDPSTSADGTGSATITYRCTKGTAPGTFQVGSASSSPYTGTLTGSGTAAGDTIGYSVTWTGAPGAGTGFGSDSTFALSGTVLNANYINKKAGSYGENVTITLSP
jgi:spore coat protein U-like protein